MERVGLSPIPTASNHNQAFSVPYQVDFSVESKGRKLGDTKRRIKWKFGFAHPPAIFPHLHDAAENYVSDSGKRSTAASPAKINTGVECRGREHEVVLTWSLLTGKASVWCDNKEVFRNEGKGDVVFNPLSKTLLLGFTIPNAKCYGRHHVNLRCYAMTPIGAKNMQVDANGGTFRQYNLMVDGLSYFAMTPMFELGTDRMWDKVEPRGFSSRAAASSGRDGSGGDDFFNKPKRSQSYDDRRDFDRKPLDQRRAYLDEQGIDREEYNAMGPRSGSEEERMIRVAMKKSLGEYNRPAPPYNRLVPPSRNGIGGRSGRGKKNDGKLLAVTESVDLLDFGDDDGGDERKFSNCLSHISLERGTSDVSLLADDDMTTASFVAATAWKSAPAQLQGSSSHPSHFAMQPPLTPQYHDPTYGQQQQQQQQQWGSYSQGRPAPATNYPSGVSFAVPPPPTWDDYNNAFGASAPPSFATPVFASPPPVAAGGGGEAGAPYGGVAPPAIATGKNSSFDPLRMDPFAS